MKPLIFATHNKNKVSEVASILHGQFDVKSLFEIGFKEDIPEPFYTIKENAIQKAKVVHEKTGLDCFSEDTGLEVEALNGEPGVRSARYAGEEHDFEANIEKLLGKMKNIKNRRARFVTIICLIWNGKQYLFEGECKGSVLQARKGSMGFGYDSIFIPEGSSKSFAEMEMEEKNKFSHRRKATEKLIRFLQEPVS
ncbi:MAG: RdgB/HAM1 family non-canonical purine NTP pyrophosphatase [Chitinophagaceae bacterium]|nr:RdgB/HAM1 family non-canonical purine NTP pyrophosphatase [Chitinophagaceae bacterium]